MSAVNPCAKTRKPDDPYEVVEMLHLEGFCPEEIE